MLTRADYSRRRKVFSEKIGKGSVAILSAAPEAFRNGDTHFPYRQNSDFYYLTGFEEPEAFLVIIPGRAAGEYILFNRKKDPIRERWEGERLGQIAAIKALDVHEAYPVEEFDQRLPQLLEGYEKLYFSIGRNAEFDERVIHAVNTLRSRVRAGVQTPNEYIHIEPVLHNMRVVKDAQEQAIMRKAGEISAHAHERAMRHCKPGMYEYELEAELLHEFYRKGSRYPAYPSIVGGGANACVLHYVNNSSPLKSGDLVLVDAGCEYAYYASDITRTYPINGVFSPEQKAIYELVLKSQLTAIAALKPGLAWNEPQNIISKVLTEGLIELGILKGSLSDNLEKKTYTQFFMHYYGHWLGLDTHDAGAYKVGEKFRLFEPGMVTTVEPGLYISADTPGVDKRWWNIGVRIEDDVLITASGCEVMTSAAPKTVAEIEACMSKHTAS